MRYYNAVQAAKEIGVSDKTVRNWIEDGKLSAERTPSNRLAIPASEVERLKKVYARFSGQEESPAEIRALSVRLLDLERRCVALEQRVTELEQENRIEKALHPSLSSFSSLSPATLAPSPQKRASVPSESIPVDVPAGSLLLADFAEQYGVPRGTVSYHVRRGIAGEKLITIDRPKPGRPEHTERWLTPGLQEQAVAYWRRHGVKFQEPDGVED